MEHRLDPSRFAVSRNVPGLSVHYFNYTSLVTPPKRELRNEVCNGTRDWQERGQGTAPEEEWTKGWGGPRGPGTGFNWTAEHGIKGKQGKRIPKCATVTEKSVKGFGLGMVWVSQGWTCPCC